MSDLLDELAVDTIIWWLQKLDRECQ